MKKRIFIVVFLLGATFSYAQVDVKGILVEGKVDTTRGTFKKLSYRTIVPKNAIAFNLGYGIPVRLANGNWNAVGDWQSKAGMNLLFGVDYKHHFFDSRIVGGEEIKQPKMLGLGIGLGVSHLSKKLYMEDHTQTVHNFIDRDGDTCDLMTSYKGVSKKVSATYLDIPLYLEIGRPSQVKISGYFNVGLKASIRISSNMTGNGTCTRTGFYKQIGGDTAVNVTIHGVEDLSYNDDEYYRIGNSSKFLLWGTLSGGISIPFSSLEKNKVSSCILRLGARADFSIFPPLSEPYYSFVSIFGFDAKLIYCF